MIHIHSGDAAAAVLRQSGIPGENIVWCDLLMDGPLPAGCNGVKLAWLRAASLAGATGGALSIEACQRRLEEQDAAVDRAFAAADEVVLWIDACLYDQLILIRLLDRLAEADYRCQASLLCVDAAPGHSVLHGYGELTPAEIAPLLPLRRPVTAVMLAEAQTAWCALCAPTPELLVELARRVAVAPAELPSLQDALCRLLEQYPAKGSGLDRLQQEVLEAVRDGADSLIPLFRAVSAREQRPFFGDTYLWRVVNELAAAPHPALILHGPGPLPLWGAPPDLKAWRLELTPTGRALLDGTADWVLLNGLDRWIGGVHLAALASPRGPS